MLKLVQLVPYAKRKPHQLSGGQQQRVALARSLAKKPQLLLLDEPLGALDKKLREETQIELANIVDDVGVTCVIVTHDQEEAMTMASRIAVMSEGRFLQVGAPAEIYETPASRFVADFIGNVNLMDGTLVEDEPDSRRRRLRRRPPPRRPRHHRHARHGGDGRAAPGEDPAAAATRLTSPAIPDVGPQPGARHDQGGRLFRQLHRLSPAAGERPRRSRSARATSSASPGTPLTWGDKAWATWTDLAQVVLTQ